MSAVIDKPSTDTIRASFNYVIPTGKPAIRYIDWPEMEHQAVPPQYELREMTIRNGRPVRDTFNRRARLSSHRPSTEMKTSPTS